jgi:hypothetical protein
MNKIRVPKSIAAILRDPQIMATIRDLSSALKISLCKSGIIIKGYLDGGIPLVQIRRELNLLNHVQSMEK